jgi:hypothetical protein
VSAYSAAHYRRVSPPADTKADITARLRRQAAWAKADADMQARYPVITVENFTEACQWRERRALELLR